MANAAIVNQPAFYLLIAASLLLSFGYLWGYRRNKTIIRSTFESLIEIFKPKDQQFTNIGGLSGYHANLIPHRNRFVRRVDVTMTLLPRQSWLYLPFSRLVRKFDRLYMVFHLSPRATGTLREGHIIEKQYSHFHGAKIEREGELASEPFPWGGKTFYLFWEDEDIRSALERCVRLLGEPGPLRHVALVPEQERMFLFMIPKPREVKRIVQTVNGWLTQFLGSRIASGATVD